MKGALLFIAQIYKLIKNKCKKMQLEWPRNETSIDKLYDNLDIPHYSFGVSNKYNLCLGIVVNCLNLFLVTLYRLQVVVTL